MHTKFFLVFVFSFFLFCSCQEEGEHYFGKEIVVPIKRGERIALSDFCTSINYTVLIQNKVNYIGNISKLVKHADTLYIFDEKQQVIHKYDIFGNFISKFSNHGKGPGEYIEISDFTIDTANRWIEVLDIGNRKIITTDFCWNFISERHKPGYFKLFEALNTNIYIFYASNYINPIFFEKSKSYNLLITDSNNTIIRTFLPIHHKNYTSSEPNQLVRCPRGVLLATPLGNEIFFANSEECYVKYRINFKKYNVGKRFDHLSNIDDSNVEDISKAFHASIDWMNKNAVATNISSFFEANNSLYFQFFLSNDSEFSKNGFYYVAHNLKSGKTLVGIPENDIDYGLFGKPLTMHNDTLYTVIYTHSLRKRISEMEKRALNEPALVPHIQKLKRLAGKKEDEFNPIIAKIALKTEW